MTRVLHRRGLIPALLLATVLGRSAPAQDSLSTDCAEYTSVPLPPAVRQPAVPSSFPDCASYRAYQGIGRQRNYSEALACASLERLAQQAKLRQNPKEPIAWVVGGSLILADMYFNGAGVKRNIPLALRFACEWERGAAKLAISELNESGTSKRFEFCDYGFTTFTMNFCGAYASEISDDRRRRYFTSLRAAMPAEQQSAFDKLLAAHTAYVEAHASEVDHGGTIATLRVLSSKEILSDLFRTKVALFERQEFPVRTSAEIGSADAWLNRTYQRTLQQLRNRSSDEISLGAVTADGVATAHASWLAYREAWISFARLRYPSAVAAIRAEVTLERNRLLKTIL